MSVTAICREQQEWAANRGIAFDARGYVPHLDLNLMRPLSPATLAAFAGGDGGELLERGDRPAKMRALHSSSALTSHSLPDVASILPYDCMQLRCGPHRSS